MLPKISSDEKFINVVVEILKYRIRQIMDLHQISFEEAKALVLDTLGDVLNEKIKE